MNKTCRTCRTCEHHKVCKIFLDVIEYIPGDVFVLIASICNEYLPTIAMESEGMIEYNERDKDRVICDKCELNGGGE